MNFENALRLLKAGYAVRLPTWKEKEFLCQDDDLVTLKPILMLKSPGFTTEWECPTEELFSNRWEVKDALNIYDQGYEDGFDMGYDLALKRYLDFLDKAASGEGIKTLEECKNELRNLQKKQK